MLKERAVILNKVSLIIDLIVTAFSFVLAYYIRHRLLVPWLEPLFPLERYSWLLFIILPLWWVLFNVQGLYRPLRTISLMAIFKIIFKTVFAGISIILAWLFIFKLHYVSRPLVLLFGLTNIFLLVAKQLVVKYILISIRKSGYDLREVLIVGTGESARRLIRTIFDHKEWGFRIIGLISREPEMAGEKIEGVKVIGLLEDVPNLIKEKVIDEVIFAVPQSWLPDLEKPFYTCEEMGINTRLSVDWFHPLIAKSHLDEFNGSPLLTFSTVPDYGWALFTKNALDLISSFFLLILLSPLFLIIALLIKITSKGPVFFSQTRLGLNGRKFSFYKFRSMVADAEKRQKELLGDNVMSGPVFKIKNDPRVTPFGRFLRKSSMDELPQLYNVLKGEMSLVGPRPPLPSEVTRYGRWQRRRLSVKPGITGLWQVSGRNEIDFDEWMKMDLKYIDNWSLWFDFKILVKTIWVVLTAKGAY